MTWASTRGLFVALAALLPCAAFSFSGARMGLRLAAPGLSGLGTRAACSRPASLGITMQGRFRGGGRGGRGGAPGGAKKSGRMGKMVMQELMTILRGGLSRNLEDEAMREALAVKTSIVDVEMTPDVKVAKVHISVIGSDEDKDYVVSWLQLNSKTIRYELAQNMKHLRTVPSLRFIAADVGAAMDVMSILDKISKEREVPASSEVSREESSEESSEDLETESSK